MERVPPLGRVPQILYTIVTAKSPNNFQGRWFGWAGDGPDFKSSAPDLDTMFLFDLQGPACKGIKSQGPDVSPTVNVSAQMNQDDATK